MVDLRGLTEMIINTGDNVDRDGNLLTSEIVLIDDRDKNYEIIDIYVRADNKMVIAIEEMR